MNARRPTTTSAIPSTPVAVALKSYRSLRRTGGPRGDVIVLRRCLDESGRVVTQDGKKLDQPQFKKPHIYTVRLEKRAGEDWWRSGIAEQGKPC